MIYVHSLLNSEVYIDQFLIFFMKKDTNLMDEKMQSLISLLQSTKDAFENLKTSTKVISSVGDQLTNVSKYSKFYLDINQLIFNVVLGFFSVII